MTGFSDEGFTPKRLQQIRTELEESFRVTFGNDIRTDVDSVTGQLIGLLAKREANLWEMADLVANSRNPSSATGVFLDRANEFVAVPRLAATTTTVTCVCSGTPGTTIPSGSLVTRSSTDDDFESVQAKDIDTSSAIDAVVEVTVASDNTHSIIINGVSASYTANSDDKATIAAQLRDSVNATAQPVTATVNSDDEVVLQSDDTETPYTISVTSDLTILTVGSPIEFQAVNAGPIRAPALSITEIGTAVAGWDEVINYIGGVSGRVEESDSEYRARRRSALGTLGGSTDEAITARIQQVDNVSYVRTFSNRTNSVDALSRPAKSFEVVVDGGANSEIAETIFNTQPAGIESYGTTTENVIDSTGNTQTVSFSRPETVFVWVRAEIELYEEEMFPVDGISLVGQEIVQYAANEYVVGKDVIRQRLARPIYNIEGIGNVTLSLATSLSPGTEPSPSSYLEQNIDINDRQRAEVTLDRVTVVQV